MKKLDIAIDKILDINRQEEDMIRPEYISYDRVNWFNKDQDIQEFYLDFETLNEVNQNNLVNQINNQLIFMIGVGHVDKNTKEWEFKCFVMKEKTRQMLKIKLYYKK